MPRKRRKLFRLMATIRQRAAVVAGRGSVTATIADTDPPTVPQGLTATAVSSSQINLAWSASTDTTGVVQSGVASYKVRRGGTLIATVSAPTLTYQNTGLSASTLYTYTVSAVDGYGNESAQSTSASATTQASGSTTIAWPTQNIAAFEAAYGRIPIVRNLVGPGCQTLAGTNRGGAAPRIYKVTSLSGSASIDGGTTENGMTVFRGSLRGATNHFNANGGPAVIVFEVAGTIDLGGQSLIIGSPSRSSTGLTISGQTAPAPGIQLKGRYIDVLTSDVLIQHITVRRGNVSNDGVNDCIQIYGNLDTYGPAHRVVLDHITTAFGQDEDVSAGGNYHDVTVAHCLSHDNLDTPTEASKYCLFQSSDNSSADVLWWGNLMFTNAARNPLTRARRNAILNNYYYCPTHSGFDTPNPTGVYIESESGGCIATVAGNVTRKGVTSTTSYNWLYNDTTTTLPLTIYVARNFGHTSGGTEIGPAVTDQTVLCSVVGGVTLRKEGDVVPYMPAGMVWVGQSSAADVLTVPDKVTRYVGSRPGERWRQTGRYDVLTAQVVTEARSPYGPGDTVNPSQTGTSSVRGLCLVEDLPSLWTMTSNDTTCYGPDGVTSAARTRTLSLPSNPQTLQSSGYTNLEAWLHAYEDEVL